MAESHLPDAAIEAAAEGKSFRAILALHVGHSAQEELVIFKDAGLLDDGHHRFYHVLPLLQGRQSEVHLTPADAQQQQQPPHRHHLFDFSSTSEDRFQTLWLCQECLWWVQNFIFILFF